MEHSKFDKKGDTKRAKLSNVPGVGLTVSLLQFNHCIVF